MFVRTWMFSLALASLTAISSAYDITNKDRAVESVLSWIKSCPDDVSKESLVSIMNFVDERDVSQKYYSVGDVEKFMKEHFYALEVQGDGWYFTGIKKFMGAAESFEGEKSRLSLQAQIGEDEVQQSRDHLIGIRMLVRDVIGKIISSYVLAYRDSMYNTDRRFERTHQEWKLWLKGTS